MLDTDGYIVWYLPNREAGGPVTRLASGDYVFDTSLRACAPLCASGLEVVTPLNYTLATLTEERGAARAGRGHFNIHHDVVATEDNTLVFLVLGDTVTANDTTWVGEEIWEWDPETDALDRRWISSDFMSPLTDRGPRTRVGDWLHANSLSIGPRGNIVVSFFWTHEVVSISPDFASIEWRMGGSSSSFSGIDDAMEAGQHTAAEIETDRVLLFDNGRDRASGLYSRALEIGLDRSTGTASVVWEFRPTPDIYAPIISSARRLNNGNTVVQFGLAAGVGGGTGPSTAFEVSPSEEVLWQVIVEGIRLNFRAEPWMSVGSEEAVSAPSSIQPATTLGHFPSVRSPNN